MIALKERGKMLFENRVFLSGIYLDPRYKFLLSVEETKIARVHLSKTLMKMNHLQEHNHA